MNKKSKKTVGGDTTKTGKTFGYGASDIPRILVVDDDPLFRRKILREAKKYNVPLTVCASPQELGRLDRRDFDVALIDHFLDEDVFGTDVASIMGPTPVILMSTLPKHCVEDSGEWPTSIRRFVRKDKGFQALLETAISVSRATQM